MVDLMCRLEEGAKCDEIVVAVKEAVVGDMEGVLGFTVEEVVSTNSLSCKALFIFDVGVGIASNDNFVKLVRWSENECSHSNRLSCRLVDRRQPWGHYQR